MTAADVTRLVSLASRAIATGAPVHIALAALETHLIRGLGGTPGEAAEAIGNRLGEWAAGNTGATAADIEAAIQADEAKRKGGR